MVIEYAHQTAIERIVGVCVRCVSQCRQAFLRDDRHKGRAVTDKRLLSPSLVFSVALSCLTTLDIMFMPSRLHSCVAIRR